MNRYDWIVVGMCLYGIHLMSQGLLGGFSLAVTPGFAEFDLGDGFGTQTSGFSRIQTAGILSAVARSFLGSCLILISFKFGTVLTKAKRQGEGASGAGESTNETSR